MTGSTPSAVDDVMLTSRFADAMPRQDPAPEKAIVIRRGVLVGQQACELQDIMNP